MAASEDRSVFELASPSPTRTDLYGTSSDQVIDFFLPVENSRTLVILIHGGYWRPDYDRKHLAPFAAALAKKGWPVALIEYRRIIGNPNALLSDVTNAIKILKAEFKDFILVGHSAGGHLALIMANDFQPKGVIALAPVTDLARAEELDLDEGAVSDFLGSQALLHVGIDPIRRPPLEMKTALFHGELDARVPIEFAHDYVSKMGTSKTQFFELAGVGHFELIDPREPVFQEICRQLNEMANN